jgi:hypothetical protein
MGMNIINIAVNRAGQMIADNFPIERWYLRSTIICARLHSCSRILSTRSPRLGCADFRSRRTLWRSANAWSARLSKSVKVYCRGPPFSGFHPRLAAQRAAETLDGCGGGRSDIDEDGINRALDVCPRAAGGGGHALEGACGLALLRLQDAQVSARVLA